MPGVPFLPPPCRWPRVVGRASEEASPRASVPAAFPRGVPFSSVRAGVKFPPLEKGCRPVTPLGQFGAFPQHPWLAHRSPGGPFLSPPQLAHCRVGQQDQFWMSASTCLSFFLAEVEFPVPKPALISQLERGEAPWGPDPWAAEVWSCICPGEYESTAASGSAFPVCWKCFVCSRKHSSLLFVRRRRHSGQPGLSRPPAPSPERLVPGVLGHLLSAHVRGRPPTENGDPGAPKPLHFSPVETFNFMPIFMAE